MSKSNIDICGPLLFRNFNFTVVDLFHDVRRMLTIDSATNRARIKRKNNNVLASTEDFLDSTRKLVSVGTFTENLGDLDDLIESDVTAVLNYALQINSHK